MPLRPRHPRITGLPLIYKKRRGRRGEERWRADRLRSRGSKINKEGENRRKRLVADSLKQLRVAGGGALSLSLPLSLSSLVLAHASSFSIYTLFLPPMAAPAPIPDPVMDECAPPTLKFLDERAQSTKKKPDGGPVVAREWFCMNREGHKRKAVVLNEPLNNFLLMLPPLRCKECGCVVSPPPVYCLP